MTILSTMSTIGQVISEDSSMDAGLFDQPMPASASSDALLLDIFGAHREFTIKGKFTKSDIDGTQTTIAVFIGHLDALISGSQVPIVYTSVKTGGPFNVLVKQVSWSASPGDVNEVDYTLVLGECST